MRALPSDPVPWRCPPYQPQPNCLSPAEVCEALELPKLRGRKWHVQSAVAIKGEGLYEGLDWLSNTLKGMQKSGIMSSVKA